MLLASWTGSVAEGQADLGFLICRRVGTLFEKVAVISLRHG